MTDMNNLGKAKAICISNTSPELLISGKKSYGYALGPGMKKILSVWFRTSSIKMASFDVSVYYPFKYIFLWFKKITHFLLDDSG